MQSTATYFQIREFALPVAAFGHVLADHIQAQDFSLHKPVRKILQEKWIICTKQFTRRLSSRHFLTFTPSSGVRLSPQSFLGHLGGLNGRHIIRKASFIDSFIFIISQRTQVKMTHLSLANSSSAQV